MTSPAPLPPHQDPAPQPDGSKVSMLEYVTTLIHTLDRRFDTLHQDLKDSITDRFAALALLTERVTSDADLRYQQRFDAQTKALDAALAAQKEAVQCVSMDTPVLCADLTWRPAGELRVGDELIAFDEESPVVPAIPRPVGRGQGRRMCRAVVTGNSILPDALLRVTTPFGSVRCNYEHPWLARRKTGHAAWNRWRWIKAADLLPGDELMRPMDVWALDRSWEAGWLAGMLDGEGCLCFKNAGPSGRARLSIVQRQSDTAAQIEATLKARVDTVAVRRRPGVTDRHHPKLEFEINVRTDILTILGSVRPPRLLAAADKVWDGRPVGGGSFRTAVITSVEDAGTGLVASLSTSTGTYIAGGYAMHNTALVAAEKATSKAEVAADKRFDSVNEFRAQLNDQAGTFIPRAEAEARFLALSLLVESKNTALTDKIDDLKTASSDAGGASRGRAQLWGLAVGAVGVVAVLISVVNTLSGKG